ncbi:hypothetical protein AB0E69_03090 [Kribbella sp. NPDC026611]|uniref:hypothetical protein n=1 Tax=Kribbella sp. NPDC026611 TaxID=3154911 RepID=UPI0033FBCE21
MKPTEFVKVNGSFWGEHLKGVSGHLPVSHRTELPGPMVFPRLMVLTETPDWNILELVGLSREYRTLEVRREKVRTVEEYFGVGTEAPAVMTLPGESLFKDATVATQAGRRALVERLPSALGMLGQEYVAAGEELLKFAPGNYATFDRTLLVHTTDDSIRVHWTFFAVAIHRSEPADKYLEYLQNYSNARPHLDPIGTISLPIDPAELKPDAFASTYLAHGLQDVTVDEFLDGHEEILLPAFGGSRLVRRPSLGDDLQPDFILEREDGSHVIGALQLPVVDTAGGKKRRRSLRTNESVQNLTRYADYFTSQENRAEVKSKYDVDVTDPRKLLIVPSHELVAKGQPGVEIVDYDTILRLHLAAK